MQQKKHVLIVEDEPLIVNSIEMALNHISDSDMCCEFKICKAKDCDTGLEQLEKALHGIPIDIVILDISIPPSINKLLLCGEDLGQQVRCYFPNAKIIVLTSYNDNYRLNSILKSLNPEGFLIKTEIDLNGLIQAISTIVIEPPFYSKAILKLMRKHIANDFVLDKIDRQLLYHLSKGTKNKDLPNFLALSKGGIERRKRNLIELFGIDGNDDKKLLAIAEEKGFL